MTRNRIFGYAGSMPKTDKDIGEAVARLRAQTPQRDIAERMSKRGFKWTQGTVSSIEKGERSLKLTEANELALILDVPVRMFTVQVPGVEAFIRLREDIKDYATMCEALRMTVRSVLSQRAMMGLSRLVAERIDVAEWEDGNAKDELQYYITEARRLADVPLEKLVEDAKRAYEDEDGYP